MSETEKNNVVKTPWHLWAVGIVSFLWNSMGAFDYIMTQTKNVDYLSGFTPEQLSFFYSLPVWVVALWAIAVWGSVVGSILLLLRKRIVVKIFLVTFIAMLITTFQNYVLSNGLEVMGDAFSLIFSAIIFLIALGLYFYSKAMLGKGLLK